MSRVLIALPEDLLERVRATLLWRPEIDRLVIQPDLDGLVQTIRDRRPRLLVFDGRRVDAVELVREIRADADARDVSIAALVGDRYDLQPALRDVSVNVVLSSRESEPLWDDAFQELVNVPPRRWVTMPVRVALGARPSADAEKLPLVMQNISVRGLLLQAEKPLPLGTVISLFLRLPARPDELHLVGRVVWEKSDGDVSRQGIEFLGFHGDAMGAIAQFVAAAAAAV
jgi:hypothetical protein